MKPVIIAGPPSSGKTAVIFHVARLLQAEGAKVAAIKFDTQSNLDPEFLATRLGIPTIGGISGYLCPDHYFVSNLEEAMDWGRAQQADYLLIETAGLCLRCAPHVENILAVTVIDALGGIQAPHKMGPMLAKADVVLLTKGDLVSQAEREVILFGIRKVNPGASIFSINGLIGTGSLHLAQVIRNSQALGNLEGSMLRHDMPAAICSYCTGEKRVGRKFQSGSVEKLNISPAANTRTEV